MSLDLTGAQDDRGMQVLVPAFVQIKNFGDKLNDLLIREVFGHRLALDSANVSLDEAVAGTKVLAIGSYLSQDFLSSFDSVHRAVVFGLGAGYGDFPIVRTSGLGRRFPVRVDNKLQLPISPLPAKNSAYAIYWVRGPLTAQVLGLPQDLALADAAYMIRQCRILQTYSTDVRDGVAFMPHFTAANSTVDLQRSCEAIGMNFIDPGGPVDETLSKIASARVLITEALHGAIVADALRTPWIPVKSSDDVFEFKWRDFCASIDVSYEPHPIRVRWDVRHFIGKHPKNLAH